MEAYMPRIPIVGLACSTFLILLSSSAVPQDRKKRANSARAGRKWSLITMTAGLSLVGSAWGGVTACTKLTCHGEATARGSGN
jgi:hypothetical protein